VSSATVHRGSGFFAPESVDERLAGEVAWLEAEPAAVSTSGPALALAIDASVTGWAGGEPIVVVRVRQGGLYVGSPRSEWRDPDGHLAACAEVVLDDDGAVHLPIALPYAAFPTGVGGAACVEVAVHDRAGPLVAYGLFDVELPDDVERVPDLLTVLVHALVALVRVDDGAVSSAEAAAIRALLATDFGLDDLGEQALARIVRTANEVEHTPESIAPVLEFALGEEGHERLVNLLYAAARSDGVVQDAEQAFIDDLLPRLGVYDHVRHGPEALRPAFEELELTPGASLAEVKAAWRRMVRDYHPDRVAHLAAGFGAYATLRTAAINQAYETLEAHLGATADPPGVDAQGRRT
jgi:DnaJ like chaperone protein